MRQTIGVLGGMGPLATADLYRKIILATPARCDQEHLHVIIDANPAIPDRTAHLLDGGPDPLPDLVAGARRLERAGADFLIIPCNTAHAFLPALRPQVAIPILDMIAEAADRAAALLPPGAHVGILATAATVRLGLYERALRERGLVAVNPDDAGQRAVSAGIHAVKGGAPDEAADRFRAEAARLTEAGVDALLAGCTEVPIVLTAAMVAVPLIDPTRTVAEAAVRRATAAPEPAARPA